MKTSAAFDRSRNRFGALLLLHRSDNASYRDEPYGARVEYYRGQNLLTASLHPTTHTRNPAFSRFLNKHGLAPLMRPYPTDFDDKAILARQGLYRRPDRLDRPVTALSGRPPPARTARRGQR